MSGFFKAASSYLEDGLQKSSSLSNEFLNVFKNIEYDSSYDNGGCDAVALAICHYFKERYPHISEQLQLAVIQRKTYKEDGLRAIESNSCSHVVAYDAETDETYDWEGPGAYARWSENWIDEPGNETVFTIKHFKFIGKAVSWLQKNKSFAYDNNVYETYKKCLIANDLKINPRIEIKIHSDFSDFDLKFVKHDIFYGSLFDYIVLSNMVLSTPSSTDAFFRKSILNGIETFKEAFHSLQLRKNTLSFFITDDKSSEFKELSESGKRMWVRQCVDDNIIKLIRESLSSRVISPDFRDDSNFPIRHREKLRAFMMALENARYEISGENPNLTYYYQS